MLIALLKGKLSHEQENMEDILTSNVFGLLKYLPAENGLLPFLRRAQTPDGVFPLSDLPDGTSADYEFWPQWQKADCAPCEPDIVLRLTLPDGSKKLVLIEAKFRSGKSTGTDQEEQAPPTDQLAKEWDNATFYAQEECAEPFVVYLTADIGCPLEAIEESRAEYRSQRGREATITWLSWRHLVILDARIEDSMLRDLGEMLKKLNLIFFRGFTPVALIPSVEWRFDLRFDWGMAPIPPVPWWFRARGAT